MISKAESSYPSSCTAEIATSICAPYGRMPCEMQEKVSRSDAVFRRGDAVVLGHLLCDRVCHDDRDGVVCGRNVEQRDENADTELAARFFRGRFCEWHEAGQ